MEAPPAPRGLIWPAQTNQHTPALTKPSSNPENRGTQEDLRVDSVFDYINHPGPQLQDFTNGVKLTDREGISGSDSILLPLKTAPRPTTTPDFNYFHHKNIRKIREILSALERPEKIIFILRGASGSGKTHLANLIKQRENEMGRNVDIITFPPGFIDCYGLKPCLIFIGASTSNFMIIDSNNCDMQSFKFFSDIGKTMGFATFAIELYQPFEICIQQNVNNKPFTQIQNEIHLMNKHRIPENETLLIATELYRDCR